jgi:hypothetical protein
LLIYSQATENSTSHSEKSRGKLTSSQSEPGPNKEATKISIAKKLSVFRDNIASDEGIEETTANSNNVNKIHRKGSSSSDTEGEDMVSDEEQKSFKTSQCQTNGKLSHSEEVIQSSTKSISYR